jgi:hypothetical protein
MHTVWHTRLCTGIPAGRVPLQAASGLTGSVQASRVGMGSTSAFSHLRLVEHGVMGPPVAWHRPVTTAAIHYQVSDACGDVYKQQCRVAGCNSAGCAAVSGRTCTLPCAPGGWWCRVGATPHCLLTACIIFGAYALDCVCIATAPVAHVRPVWVPFASRRPAAQQQQWPVHTSNTSIQEATSPWALGQHPSYRMLDASGGEPEACRHGCVVLHASRGQQLRRGLGTIQLPSLKCLFSSPCSCHTTHRSDFLTRTISSVYAAHYKQHHTAIAMQQACSCKASCQSASTLYKSSRNLTANCFTFPCQAQHAIAEQTRDASSSW